MKSMMILNMIWKWNQGTFDILAKQLKEYKVEKAQGLSEVS